MHNCAHSAGTVRKLEVKTDHNQRTTKQAGHTGIVNGIRHKRTNAFCHETHANASDLSEKLPSLQYNSVEFSRFYHNFYVYLPINRKNSPKSSVIISTVAADDFRNNLLGLCLQLFGVMYGDPKLFNHFCIHIQVFSHRGSDGCTAVHTHPNDSSTVHLTQL